jgi:peptidyl-prolyl cis-trans isomerase SurA
MVFFKYIFLLFISLSFVSAHGFAYQSLDKTAAIVGDSVILESELKKRLARIAKQQPETKLTDKVVRQIIDQLILEELQLQIARRVNLTIPDAEVETAIDNIKRTIAKENLSFEQFLLSQNSTEAELRQNIERDIKIKRVQKGRLSSRIQVTDREIDEFLKSKAGQEWLKIRYRLNHILLPVQGDNEAQIVQLAEKIITSAQSQQASFEALAAKFSQGPNAAKGGDLGWREKSDLPELFVQQVGALEAGEISRPFKSNAGIHILKLTQRSGANAVMVQRYKVRHILVSPTELFTEAEAKQKIDSIYQKLIKGADFIELAKANTDDDSNKLSGGDLGWSVPGQFVSQFEKAMASTPVNNISQPFRTQFGWHILKVDDTKVEDMFERVKRNRAAEMIRARRFQDELQLWLQELREDTYVEVLI